MKSPARLINLKILRKIIYHKEVLMLTALLGLTEDEKEPRNFLYLEYTRV